jgi:hypothetical protein
VTYAVLESGHSARSHHLPAAGLAVVAVALLVVLPELLGDLGRLAAVLVLQLGLVLAWVLVTGIQGFAGSLAVGAAAAVAADLVLGLPARPMLGSLLPVFGIGFLAIVVQQMFRRPRHDLVASLSGGVLLVAVVGALAALLLLGRSPAGSGRAVVALLAVGAALVVGHLVDLVLPRPRLTAEVPRGLAGLVLAVLAGAVVTFLGRDAGNALDAVAAVVYGAVLGMVASLMALAASYVVVAAHGEDVPADGGTRSEPRPPAWALPLMQVVLPLAACAPVALAMQTVL